MSKDKLIVAINYFGSFCIGVLEFIARGDTKTFEIFGYSINTQQIHFLSMMIFMYLTLLNWSMVSKCLKRILSKFL
ncbi:hypothetical protein D3M79_08945 [Rodentibacter pneumotropicus]|uniref:Uncharacterized protein n=1 Tax=Rodentibacter pneumotropicus TaxID=758 RepID=A0A4S2P6G1_9PAST|nr:hypothetical protein [Rodentibacter pneumotropicus]OOF60866.1 hypothetical protein BH925_04335 [Rodentibacter pneumotropicus]TGZ98531.1 hypothetical protein D3M79_08945 [Rodentibacter pneumotropicus]THA00936.1 hypothetical protein D3M74_06295 [Rodentibacter pneumotropicus]THA05095.1 hypothetical protein D3M77_10115 [Rodentibacter pneumotropicus]THA08204.1 hypothetical protein D3M78_08315 [Rodentibacter pneumotropicus]